MFENGRRRDTIENVVRGAYEKMPEINVFSQARARRLKWLISIFMNAASEM